MKLEAETAAGAGEGVATPDVSSGRRFHLHRVHFTLEAAGDMIESITRRNAIASVALALIV
jgi:hypothetical protein